MFFIDEEILNEGYFFDSKDVKYQVDDFVKGKVKTLFICGHSGSGKSTLGSKYEKELGVVCYGLDDVLHNAGFTDDQLKEYGKEIYEFFTGPGNKYRMDKSAARQKNGNYVFEFDPMQCIADFIKFIISKNARCIVEGIYLYILLHNHYMRIEEFKNCAMIIKGTSSAKSTYRALKRDYKSDKQQDPNIKLTDAITFDYLKFRITDMFRNEKLIKEMRKKLNELKK